MGKSETAKANNHALLQLGQIWLKLLSKKKETL